MECIAIAAVMVAVVALLTWSESAYDKAAAKSDAVMQTNPVGGLATGTWDGCAILVMVLGGIVVAALVLAAL